MTKKISTISFYEQLINAIMAKDISFIQNNIDKINFKNSMIGDLAWEEKSIFSTLISSGFTDGFKLIFDKYVEQVGFVSFDEYNFHNIIIQSCHYAQNDIIEHIHSVAQFDFQAVDENGLTLVHHLFQSFTDDLNLVSDEQILKCCKYFDSKGLNLFEPHPADPELSEAQNLATTKKAFHSIFSFLIFRQRLSAAYGLTPLIRNFNIVLNNVKTKDVIKRLERLLFLVNFDVWKKLSEDEKTQSVLNNDGCKLLVYCIEQDREAVLSILKETDFLFNIPDFYILNIISDEKTLKDIFELFLDENRLDERLNCAMSSLISRYFGTIELYKFIDLLQKFGCSIDKIVKSKGDDIYINCIISAFQSQKRPPNKNILEHQLRLIGVIKRDDFVKQRDTHGGYSYKDLINATIENWIADGFNVSLIK